VKNKHQRYNAVAKC